MYIIKYNSAVVSRQKSINDTFVSIDTDNILRFKNITHGIFLTVVL